VRTPEEIKSEFEREGCVHLSVDETEAYSEIFGKQSPPERTVFLTYSQTVTEGDKTITRTASVSVPVGYDADAILSMLRAKVNGTDHLPNDVTL